jgi:hypothetical protein
VRDWLFGSWPLQARGRLRLLLNVYEAPVLACVMWPECSVRAADALGNQETSLLCS